MHSLASLLSVLIRIEVLLIIVRVLLSWFPGIDPWNPLVRVLRAVTDPVLLPFRRILPTFSGIDVSPLLAIVVLDTLGTYFSDYADGVIPKLSIALALILQRVLQGIVVILVIIALLRLVVSLFHADPWHPATRMIRDLSRPVVGPFEAVAPRSRSFDIPALVAIVVFVIAYELINALFDHVVYPALV